MNKRVLNLKLVGVDFWSRQVFQDQETKRFYKDVNCVDEPNLSIMSLHTTIDFEGEPEYPISLKKCEINIIK